MNSLHSASEDIASQAKSGPLPFQGNIESLQYVVAMVDRHFLVLLVIIMFVCARICVCVGARGALPNGRMKTLDRLIILDLPPKSMLVLPAVSSSQFFCWSQYLGADT